jgi:hypothetical protein
VASQMIVSGSFDDIEVAKNISEYLLPKTKDGKPGKRIDIYLEARALRVVAAMQDACSKYFEKRPNKHETVTAMLSVGNFDQDKIAHDLVSAMTFKMPASKEEKQDGQAGTLNRASENNEAQDKRTSVIN